MWTRGEKRHYILGTHKIGSEGRGFPAIGGRRNGSESASVKRWAHQDSNLGPSDYESDALTN